MRSVLHVERSLRTFNFTKCQRLSATLGPRNASFQPKYLGYCSFGQEGRVFLQVCWSEWFEIDDEEGWMNIISSRLFPRASGQCQAENGVITKSRNSRDERKSRQLPETLTEAWINQDLFRGLKYFSWEHGESESRDIDLKPKVNKCYFAILWDLINLAWAVKKFQFSRQKT